VGPRPGPPRPASARTPEHTRRSRAPPIRTFTVGPGVPPGQPVGRLHRPGRGLSPPARNYTDPGAREWVPLVTPVCHPCAQVTGPGSHLEQPPAGPAPPAPPASAPRKATIRPKSLPLWTRESRKRTCTRPSSTGGATSDESSRAPQPPAPRGAGRDRTSSRPTCCWRRLARADHTRGCRTAASRPGWISRRHSGAGACSRHRQRRAERSGTGVGRPTPRARREHPRRGDPTRVRGPPQERSRRVARGGHCR